MINIMYLRRREREKLQSLYEYTLSRISPPCFFQGEDHYPQYNYGLLRGFYIHVDCETVPQLNAVLSAHVKRESLFWLPELQPWFDLGPQNHNRILPRFDLGPQHHIRILPRFDLGPQHHIRILPRFDLGPRHHIRILPRFDLGPQHHIMILPRFDLGPQHHIRILPRFDHGPQHHIRILPRFGLVNPNGVGPAGSWLGR